MAGIYFSSTMGAFYLWVLYKTETKYTSISIFIPNYAVFVCGAPLFMFVTFFLTNLIRKVGKKNSNIIDEVGDVSWSKTQLKPSLKIAHDGTFH